MDQPSDHRTRVAAVRREKMRARLLESALHVIATDGVTALTIDHLIRHAGVSRGTFYKYYDVPQDVVRELARGVSNELVALIDPLVVVLPDPAARVASGIRTLLHTCAAHPVVGYCLIHLGWTDLGQHDLLFKYVKRDVDEAQRQGRLPPMHEELALSLVGVNALAGIQVMFKAGSGAGIPEQTAAAVLRALGMVHAEAQRLAALPLPNPELPATGLIGRATNRGADH